MGSGQILTLSRHLRRRVRQRFQIEPEFPSETHIHHLRGRNAD